MSERCYCVLEAKDFLDRGCAERALNEMVCAQAETFSVEQTQLIAWEEELRILHPVALSNPECTIGLEYMIPRMGKRVDAILLTDGVVFPIEFKVGEKQYTQAARDQVADYAFDLRNFHAESHNRLIVPIVVCTDAEPHNNSLSEYYDGIYEVLFANRESLAGVIAYALRVLPKQMHMDNRAWLDSIYSPTPTIVEAAQALYESNKVEDISRHEAGLTDINLTTNCITEIIDKSRRDRRKSICFITGVPGAGKTLVGLNIASTRRNAGAGDRGDIAVFLSGNGPLIEVLQSSLANDQKKRDEEACSLCSKPRKKATCLGTCPHYRTKAEIKSEVKTFVQGVHLFREELFKSDEPPAEHIAVFDEAQRAWSKDWLSYKMRNRRQNRISIDKSEPECLIEYMDRLDDWATVVCLVGGGQEINSGEAGISEWFEVLARRFFDWDIYVSPEVRGENYLAPGVLEGLANRAVSEDALHLGVDMRSFRNKNVAAFAEAIVENKKNEASKLYREVSGSYPIYVTRDLSLVKEWVRKMTVRPSDRYGIVADSHGERIRADGVLVPSDFDAATWFLGGKDEIDSSYYMEVAASEFKIQGLEIDYAVVAWEADYRYEEDGFTYHRFIGGRWQDIHKEIRKRYLKNGYRVLLTRARQGYVIYVPKGSDFDSTRQPNWYDGTYRYLREIGILPLEEMHIG